MIAYSYLSVGSQSGSWWDAHGHTHRMSGGRQEADAGLLELPALQPVVFRGNCPLLGAAQNGHCCPLKGSCQLRQQQQQLFFNGSTATNPAPIDSVQQLRNSCFVGRTASIH